MMIMMNAVGTACKSRMLLFLASLTLVLLLPVAFQPAHAQQISSIEETRESEDWRDAMLTEMAALANALDRQRKFNELLRDKVDILNHRIEELEEQNAEQATQLSSLLEEKSMQDDGMLEEDPQARAPEPQEPLQSMPDEQDDLPRDFEQFLDMGEAMMRRFFGVVKEFRREFEDNRV